MVEPELEVAVLSRFVRAAKRERCVGFVSKPKTRDRALNELSTPAIFEPSCMTEFTGGSRTADQLSTEYRRRGMGPEVYVMSSRWELDGRRLPLAEALEESVARCHDVLAYCPRSGTAFYEWHHSGSSWFLQKAAADS
jgi:hypothetical protein